MVTSEIPIKSLESEYIWPKLSHNTARHKDSLKEIIQKYSYITGNFTLSSGRKSDYIFKLRNTLLLPYGAHYIAQIISEFMYMENFQVIGGMAIGAIPIVSSVAAESYKFSFKTPIDTFFIRTEKKDHGSKELFEGYCGVGKILIVDDVLTTGSSIIKVLKQLKEVKGEVVVTDALVIIDREEGGVENLAEHNINVYTMFKKSDFI